MLLVLAAVLLAVTASSGAATGGARAPVLGVVPHADGLASGAPLGPRTDAAPPGGNVFLRESPCSLSGPVVCWTMRTNTAYTIFWVPSGYSVQSGYESAVNRYLQDVAAASGSLTNVYSVATQYYDNAAAIHYLSTFGGTDTDTSPFPANGCGAAPTCLTDAQLQAEIEKVIHAEGWKDGPDALFFIFTPEGVGSCVDSSGAQCSTNVYCAYHSSIYDPSGQLLVYANEPYAAKISGCGSGPSPNGDDADATINTVSHEQNEAITDPWGDAWLDSGGEEIGDKCAWNFGTPLGGSGSSQYNQVINGDHYALQLEWSNDGSICRQSYTPTVAPSSVAPPVLSGTAVPNDVLSTSEGSWMHAPSGYAYQWQRCSADATGCTNISGATSASYRLVTGDVAYRIRAAVSAHNVAGSASYVPSAASAVVAAPPSSKTAPVLSGVAAVGKKLSVTAGTWSTEVTVAYQWLRCTAAGTDCAAVSGATASTYVPVAADAGYSLEAQVNATNPAGTATATSNRTSAVVGVPSVRKVPRIAGRARVGRHLTARKGSWAGPPTTYRFQWLRCNAHGGRCVRVRRATHSRYRLTKHDAGHRLRVRVTALNIAGKTTVTSRASGRVPAKKH